MEATAPPAGAVLVRMVDAFRTGALERLDEFVHPEYLDHQGLADIRPVHGIAGFERVVRTARAGLRELSVDVADLIEADDRVAARLVWSGTRLDGSSEHRETIEIVRVEDAQAIEHWGGRS